MAILSRVAIILFLIEGVEAGRDFCSFLKYEVVAANHFLAGMPVDYGRVRPQRPPRRTKGGLLRSFTTRWLLT